MIDEVERYVAFFQVGLKDAISYKWDLLTVGIFRILTPLIMLAVWYAIFTTSNATTIGGFSLTQTYSYFFGVALILILFDCDVEWEMQQDVISGSVGSYMTKPVRYLLKIASFDFANMLLGAVLAGIPFAILLFTMLKPTLTPAFLSLLLLELLVNLAFTYAFQTLLGMAAFYMTNASGVFQIVWASASFLGGITMPLNFFPSGVGSLLQLLPFQITAYTPASTLLGAISYSQALTNTAVALVWTAVFLMLDLVVWRFSVRKIAVAGG